MNWTRGHEIESDAMLDRFDGRRLVVDVVAVLLIGLRERSWREQERWKALLARVNSSCRHDLTPLWWINQGTRPYRETRSDGAIELLNI